MHTPLRTALRQSPTSPLVTSDITSATVVIEARSAAGSTAGPATESSCEPSTFRCLICLNDKPTSERTRALRCDHPLCIPCSKELWTHSIVSKSEGFPRCAMPDCDACVSDAALAALVSPQAARRMRQLRGLRPARSGDGRRMWCVEPGCHEPLPPPLSLLPPADDADEAEGEQASEVKMDSICPACGQGACMRCGIASHEGACAAPLPCGRQRRMYNEYAVGRIMACPRCGVHIERSGGCSTVLCARCSWSFTFTPFRTAVEVEEATTVQDLGVRGRTPATLGNSFSFFLAVSLSMVLYEAVCLFFFDMSSRTVAQLKSDKEYMLLIPLFMMDVFFFLFIRGFNFCISRVIQRYEELLPHVGVHAPMSQCNLLATLLLAIAMLALLFTAYELLATDSLPLPMRVGLLLMLPVILCNLTLFAITVTHIIIITVRAILAFIQRQGFKRAEEGGAAIVEDGTDVPLA